MCKLLQCKKRPKSVILFFLFSFCYTFLNVTPRTREGILSVSFCWNQHPFANNLNLYHGILNTLNIVQTSCSLSVLSNSDIVILVMMIFLISFTIVSYILYILVNLNYKKQLKFVFSVNKVCSWSHCVIHSLFHKLQTLLWKGSVLLARFINIFYGFALYVENQTKLFKLTVLHL